jgi:hypothetical protein
VVNKVAIVNSHPPPQKSPDASHRAQAAADSERESDRVTPRLRTPMSEDCGISSMRFRVSRPSRGASAQPAARRP